ncbi:hypothetical protein diail_10912 [Diaporthe ilicicola]|nr:hypothetical protein diail_10912 [Diaporthe ilicicola]
MQSKLFAVSVTLLAFIVSIVLAECYNDGMTWCYVGDDNAITKAFNDLRADMAGNYEVGSMIEKCTNVEKNRINARIGISMELQKYTTDITPYKEVCVNW